MSDFDDCRVVVFTLDGDFIRAVGLGLLQRPRGVACSAFDELVVADTDNRCLRVFSGSGDLLDTIAVGSSMLGAAIGGVAVHGGCVYAQDTRGERCFVFSD